jgi:hypothetical protein
MMHPCENFRLTKIAFIGVKSDSKAMNIANRISRSPATSYSGKSEEHIGLLSARVQEGSVRNV